MTSCLAAISGSSLFEGQRGPRKPNLSNFVEDASNGTKFAPAAEILARRLYRRLSPSYHSDPACLRLLRFEVLCYSSAMKCCIFALLLYVNVTSATLVLGASNHCHCHTMAERYLVNCGLGTLRARLGDCNESHDSHKALKEGDRHAGLPD